MEREIEELKIRKGGERKDRKEERKRKGEIKRERKKNGRRGLKS